MFLFLVAFIAQFLMQGKEALSAKLMLCMWLDSKCEM